MHLFNFYTEYIETSTGSNSSAILLYKKTLRRLNLSAAIWYEDFI